MLWILVSVVLVVLVALAILWPYLRPVHQPQTTVEIDPQLLDLYGQRDRLYQATRDAAFDLDMGKLTPEDYETHTARLKQQAAVVLRTIDETQAEHLTPEADASLEAEISRARTPQTRQNGRNGHAANDDALEAAIVSARRGKSAGAKTTQYCGRCGTAIKTGDRFCGSCGQGVSD